MGPQVLPLRDGGAPPLAGLPGYALLQAPRDGPGDGPPGGPDSASAADQALQGVEEELPPPGQLRDHGHCCGDPAGNRLYERALGNAS